MTISVNREPPHSDSLLLDLIRDVVDRLGDEPALIKDAVAVSYRELDDAVAFLSDQLTQWGVRPEARVGVCHGTSIDGTVAALAALDTGAAFVPLEMSYPDVRLRSLIEGAGVSVVLAAEDSAPRMRSLVPDACRVITWHFTQTRAAARPVRGFRPAASRPHHEQLAYIFFTSGSTGRPKGVMISHGAIANYIRWAQTEYTSLKGRAIVHSPLGFDLTLTALLGTLASGGCAVLTGPISGLSTLPDAGFVKGTPSHLPFLTRISGTSPAKELVLGGESLIGERLERWRSINPTADIINEYGPTETTVGCTARRWSPEASIPPGVLSLGRPIAGCDIYVLDAKLEPVVRGEVGELYIAGAQVARGYSAMPALTATCFVSDPFAKGRGQRMYKSGDFGWLDHHGELHFSGRRDGQIKLSGYRVELGDIESNLLRIPGVVEAAVILVSGVNPRIFGFVQPSNPDMEANSVLRYLRDRIPEYLVPAKIFILADLPRTENGKVDRQRLGEIAEGHRVRRVETVSPDQHPRAENGRP